MAKLFNVAFKDTDPTDPDNLLLGASVYTAEEAKKWLDYFTGRYGEKFVIVSTDLETTTEIPSGFGHKKASSNG